ncbi:UdgX family uracil-DNA binding protein [Dyella acidisoli]|uniref:Type-4 uracil-DNA glycosylase n=1 Tax=Dyella acidisoli TaxID=1867834 RepID=A0ABQ5XTE6_9GAMM|nr:UdgX family uracil-DNA binding protein [Dyella acidisoli]GLQ95009.1 uracil-DNA glycosylase [Dyella acidisoli]
MPQTPPAWESPLARPSTLPPPHGTLKELHELASRCHDCPLWKHATQTVFGIGPAHAAWMLVGEQPGVQEDAEGEPFVGPAGALLDRALQESGLDRNAVYLTNAVKHFKYELRGKHRLHKRANATEQAACREWLAAELREVHPQRILALGTMAAQAFFGTAFQLTMSHGRWFRLPGGIDAMATWHPSSVLRSINRDTHDHRYQQLVDDLRAFAAGPANAHSPSVVGRGV